MFVYEGLKKSPPFAISHWRLMVTVAV